MAFYSEDEEVWKCPKHLSKRRRTGVCPKCLQERLGALCSDCGKLRPCDCCSSTTTSSSTSSSSSNAASTCGSVGRVGSLIESEPAFRRSRSVGIPFLRSRSRHVAVTEKVNINERKNLPPSGKSKPPFWSVFKSNKSKKTVELETVNQEEESKEDEITREDNNGYSTRIHDFERMMIRSRSVSSSITSSRGGSDVKTSKGKSWNFPSPMKILRQTSLSKVVHDRSPLQRG